MKKYAIAPLALLAMIIGSGCTTQSKDIYPASVSAPVSSATMARLAAQGPVSVVDVPTSTNPGRNLWSETRLQAGISTEASSAIAREVSASEPRVVLVTGGVTHVVEETIVKALKDSTPNPSTTLAYAGDAAHVKSIGAAVRSAGLKFEYAGTH